MFQQERNSLPVSFPGCNVKRSSSLWTTAKCRVRTRFKEDAKHTVSSLFGSGHKQRRERYSLVAQLLVCVCTRGQQDSYHIPILIGSIESPKQRCDSINVPDTDIRPHLNATRYFLRRDLLEELLCVPTLAIDWLIDFGRRGPELQSADGDAPNDDR